MKLFILFFFFSVGYSSLKNDNLVNAQIPTLIDEYIQYESSIDVNTDEKVEYLRHLILLNDNTFTYTIYIISTDSEPKKIKLKGNFKSSSKELKLSIKSTENFECDTKEILYKKNEQSKLDTPNNTNEVLSMQMDMRKRKPLEFNNCIDNVGDSYLLVLSSKERFFKMVPFLQKRIEEILKK